MAASKKSGTKTTKKKRAGSAKSSASSKAGSAASRKKKEAERRSFKMNRLMTGALIVLFWLLGLAAVLRLGLVGIFLNEIITLLFGWLGYVLLVLGALWGFGYIWSAGQYEPQGRTVGGILSLGAAWMLMIALAYTPADDPWAALHVLSSDLPQFASHSFYSIYGFFGAFWAGIFSTLFSRTGAWIFGGVFVLLGTALLFWKPLSAFLSLSAQEKSEKLKERLPHPSFSIPSLSDLRPQVHLSPNVNLTVSSTKVSKEAAQAGPSLFEQISPRRASLSSLEQNIPTVFDNGQPVRESGYESGREDPFLNDLNSLSIPEADEDAAGSFDGLRFDLTGSRFEPLQPRTSSGFSLADIPSAADLARPLEEDRDSLASRQKEESDAVQKTAPSAKRKSAGRRTAASDSAAENLMPSDVSSGPEKKTVKNASEASSASLDEEAGHRPLYDPKTYKLPPVSLLNDPDPRSKGNVNLKNARSQGARLIEILKEFNVDARLGEIHIGPSVTEFEVVPGQGVRVNTFVNLQSDIKMALAAKDIRIEAPIPGKSAVGIEVPNAEKTPVSMKELIQKVPASLSGKPLVFALGKDLMGDSIYGRLDTMPHLLIAGATGSGKSVCVNSIICSILLRTRPDEVKLLLVDPKKVEFTPYNDIPHLLAPVITDANLASGALKVIVEMMDQRYSLFETFGVRNISSYNEHLKTHPQEGYELMPRIVVIIDELADLMLAAGKDVEQSIQRITQLARAAGIHLIVATQRPSVNVITGVIKANIPSRIAFMVSSRVDSRTILDQSGAEKLLGYGDMLFLDNGESTPTRLQGVFIRDEEVEEICSYVKQQAAPAYADPFIMLQEINAPSEGTEAGMAQDLDPLYPEVKDFVIVSRKASTSLIQRRFHLGYGRAARILDQLEANGIIGPSNGSRPREILVASPAEEMEEDY